MHVVETIEQLRRYVAEAHATGKLVGFVPTMGALHAGHASLIEAAHKQCGLVVVSIFVNPTQFGPTEDLARYPRTPKADHNLCRRCGADVVFQPSVEEMYPPGDVTRVSAGPLANKLCGASRPGHFDGVCTVVAKLFNAVQADKAYFGAKDFQQCVIIRRMVADLSLPVQIVVCPIVREGDGLAMSSRNTYLSAAERKQAVALRQALELAARMIRCEHPPVAAVAAAIRKHIAEVAPLGTIDYVSIVDPLELSDVQNTSGPVLVALAVRFGGTRLIDNVLVD